MELTKEEELLRAIFGDKTEPLDCNEYGHCIHYPDEEGETFIPVCCQCGKTEDEEPA